MISSGPPKEKRPPRSARSPIRNIFLTTREFKYDLLAKRLARTRLPQHPGIEIILEDGRSGRKENLPLQGRYRRIRANSLNRGKTAVHPLVITPHGEAPAVEAWRKTALKIVVVYRPCNNNDSYIEPTLRLRPTPFTTSKGAHTPERFPHAALTRVINNYAKANNIVKDKDPSISGDDVREGLTAVISVKSRAPLRGPTKDQAE